MFGRQVIGRSTPMAARGFPVAGVTATGITDTRTRTEVGVMDTVMGTAGGVEGGFQSDSGWSGLGGPREWEGGRHGPPSRLRFNCHRSTAL